MVQPFILISYGSKEISLDYLILKRTLSTVIWKAIDSSKLFHKTDLLMILRAIHFLVVLMNQYLFKLANKIPFP